MRKMIVALVAISGLVGNAPTAQAFDCYTDCGKVASFNYPCPTFRNPHRMCQGREPGTYAGCETTKAAACRVLEPLKDSIIHKMASAIAGNAEVRERAPGWTSLTCAAAGGSLFTAVQAGYSAPICAAMNVAAAGCVTFVIASSSLITAATCTQLCQDHQLQDCH